MNARLLPAHPAHATSFLMKRGPKVERFLFIPANDVSSISPRKLQNGRADLDILESASA